MVKITRTAPRIIEVELSRHLAAPNVTATEETYRVVLSKRGLATKIEAGLRAMVTDGLLDSTNGAHALRALGFSCVRTGGVIASGPDKGFRWVSGGT